MTMTKNSPLAPRIPNAETRAAMEESRAIMKSREARFIDAQELLDALDRTAKQ